MPELPEVEATRRLLAAHILNKKILSATVLDDTKVVQGIAPADLQSQLVGCTVVDTGRKGKHLWLVMADNKPHLLFHLGMNGAMIIRNVGASKYKRMDVDTQEWPPRFWKLTLDLQDGLQVAFTDARRFGKIQFVVDPLCIAPISGMGPDCFTEMPSAEQLQGILSTRRIAIKTALLDQAVLAGIGNWVADEVLYHARIHPETKANALTASQVQVLRDTIEHVCQVAVEADADYELFPENWIFDKRWSKGAAVKDSEGRRIEFIEVGGRTTAFVPAVQKKTASDDSSGRTKKGEKKTAAAAEKSAAGKKATTAKEPSKATKGKTDDITTADATAAGAQANGAAAAAAGAKKSKGRRSKAQGEEEGEEQQAPAAKRRASRRNGAS